MSINYTGMGRGRGSKRKGGEEKGGEWREEEGREVGKGRRLAKAGPGNV